MRRIPFIVGLLLLPAATAIYAQPAIQTVLGGAPDGLPATSVSLNSPSSIAVDSQGILYVGLRQAHQVVKIDSKGIVTIVAGNGVAGYTGDGGPARQATLGTPAGLAVDKAGNLYIADSANNVIRRVNSIDNTISTFAGTSKASYSGDNGPATKATLKQPTALLVDPTGNLLIADTGNNAVRKVGADGNITLFAGTGTGNPSSGGDEALAVKAGLYSPSGLAIDSTGLVYIADSGNGRLRYVTTDGVIHLLAGRGGAGYSGDGGNPLNASFYYPSNLSVDQSDQLYINDQGNYRIRRIQVDGRIYSFAGTGVKGAEGDQGYAKAANLDCAGLIVDPKNNVYMVDADNNRVRMIRASDGIIDSVAGNGVASYNPNYLLRSGNNLYVSDGNNQRVRLFDMAAGSVVTVTGDGSANFTGDGAAAQAAEIHNPRGMAFDKAGNLYLADSANHRIRKIDASGNITTFAGTGTASTSGDGGSAASATFNEPTDIAYDASNDSLYIAERSGHVVRQVAVSGNSVKTVAGTGDSAPPDSETGVAVNQSLSLPQGIFVEGPGTILIADTGNHRVRRLTSDGTITTIVGTGTPGFSGDGGPAPLANLRSPVGLAKDDAGNLYVAEADNSTVRQIGGSDGVITTVAGFSSPSASRLGGYNGDGSPATNYQLNRPFGLASSPASCSVLVADTSNGRVRQVTAGVNFVLATNPPGLAVTVDGGSPIATPATVTVAAGTNHTFSAPAIQDPGTGTRYLSTTSSTGSLPCGTPRQNVTVRLRTQYSLTITPDTGGSVTAVDQWQDPGTQLTLTATPADGFTFTGWEGDCTGTDVCLVTMDQPKNILAHFAPAQQ